MDALVPPANSTSGFVVSDDHRGHKSHNHDHSAEILNRVSTAAENIMNNDNANAHHAASTAERIGLAGIDHMNQNGSEGRLVTNQNGAEGRGATERFGLANMEATHKEGHETRDDVDKFGFRTQDAIERFGLKNLEATKDGLKDLLISTKDDLKSVLISQKDDIKDLLISNKNDFKEVLLKNCQVEKDMLLQFKDAQLVAMQNKSDLEKQIAECCCEQKELTRAEGSATRDLIRSENEARLREKLDKANQELVALRLRASLTPPLVGSVPL